MANVRAVLESVEAREDLAQRLNELFDQEVLEEASFRVRLEMPPHYWDVFQQLAVEGLSGSEVAQRMKIVGNFATLALCSLTCSR